jgi:arginyl-tRNA synthetase
MLINALLCLTKFKHKKINMVVAKQCCEKIQVEFVSANPTSSLHVGHGRGAAYGMTVANF